MFFLLSFLLHFYTCYYCIYKIDLFLIASTSCTITFLYYKILIILVDNDVNKVHRKFPLDTCLICLNFFPAIRCYYSHWFSYYFKNKLNIRKYYRNLKRYFTSIAATLTINFNRHNQKSLKLNKIKLTEIKQKHHNPKKTRIPVC